MKAFLPEIDKALGIYLPLIVVNCIILARAEMFASKNGPLLSVLDAIGMGAGFTAALTVIGAGTFFGLDTPLSANPMLIMILPPGGFFVFGVVVAITNALAKKRGKQPVNSTGCGSCHGCDGCKEAEQ